MLLEELILEFLYSPKPRWMYLRKVTLRFLRRIASLYVSLRARVNAGDVTAPGIVNRITDILFIYVGHILVDTLEPLARFNVRHQSPRALVFEVKYDFEQLLQTLEAYMQHPIGPSEKLFERRFKKESWSYLVPHERGGEDCVPVEFRGASRRPPLELEAEKKRIRLSVYQSLLTEIRHYREQCPDLVQWFSVFDLRKLPSRDGLEDYVQDTFRPAIESIFGQFSSYTVLQFSKSDAVCLEEVCETVWLRGVCRACRVSSISAFFVLFSLN